MDQYPFEFKITVLGLEVDLFIEHLRISGFHHQADEMEEQFKKQLDDI